MKPIGEKLLGIFREEHHEHAEQIRLLIDRILQAESPVQDLDEAFRRAHSLKGAARAVDISEIESLGHRLETLFARVRRGELQINSSVAEVVHDALDCSEDILANLAGRGVSPATPEVLAAIDRLLTVAPLVQRPPGGQAEGETPLPPAPAGRDRGHSGGRPAVPGTDAPGAPIGDVSDAVLHEEGGANHAERGEASMHLRAAQVSRLLRTCDQLLGAAPLQESLTRGARELARELEDLTNAWGRLRAAIPSSRRGPRIQAVRPAAGRFRKASAPNAGSCPQAPFGTEAECGGRAAAQLATEARCLDSAFDHRRKRI